jgi:hypothetical protein
MFAGKRYIFKPSSCIPYLLYALRNALGQSILKGLRKPSQNLEVSLILFSLQKRCKGSLFWLYSLVDHSSHQKSETYVDISSP